MNENYQEILDRSYGPQMLMTFVGVMTGIGAKTLTGELSTWSLGGIVTVLQKDPMHLLGGFLLFIVALLSLIAAAWIGIGALTSRWSEMDPRDKVVRIGVLVLLVLCLAFIAYSAFQFLFLALLGTAASAGIAKLITFPRKRVKRFMD